MVTERDTESGRDQQHGEHREMEPINTEIPQVQRHYRECENKRADQERAGRPVNAVRRNAENHGEKIFERITGSAKSTGPE